MPIIIVPNEEMLEASNNLQNSRILFSTPGFYFAHNMSGVMPAAHNVTITIPRFDTLPEFEDFTNWKILVASEYTAPVPWLWASPSSVTGLGTPGTDGEGNPVYTRSFNFMFMNLYGISAGTYYANGYFKIVADNSLTGEEGVIIAERYYPIVAVLGYPSPSILHVDYFENLNDGLVFSYFIGGSGFASQPVFIYSAMEHSVTLNDASGLLAITESDLTGYKKVSVNFVTPGLEPEEGVIEAELVIDPDEEGVDSITVPIKIFVHAASGADLAAVPTTITFTDVIGSLPNAAPQTISLLSTSAWTLDDDLPAWLDVSPVSGSGNATLTVSVKAKQLPAGVRGHVLNFSNTSGTIALPVTFTLLDYLSTTLSQGGLFFTRDLDYLRFRSDTENTHVIIELRIKVFALKTYEPTEFIREYDLPLFNGVGEFHPGTVVEQLMEELSQLEQSVSEFSVSHYSPQYKPAEVRLLYTELNYTDDATVKTGVIETFYMVKGISPGLTAIKTALLETSGQQESRITPASVLSLSFCHFKTPDVIIRKNGIIVDRFTVVSYDERKVLYSYFRYGTDMAPGDVIELEVRFGLESRTKRFLCFPEGKENTYILFENAWGLLEAFEFTGRRRLSSGYSHTTALKFTNLYETNRKVDSKNVQAIVINSGHLLPADHKLIDAIIKSRNVWCAFNDPAGRYYKVDATTSKIINSDTDSPDTSFDVEFNILDNADVSIYLQ